MSEGSSIERLKHEGVQIDVQGLGYIGFRA